MPEDNKEYIKGENLYNTNHKTTSQAYRDRYDKIKWDQVKSEPTPKKSRQN
jgi:hypothetical protein